MNRESVIVCINSKEDIKKITENTRYINISINNVNMDVINYFLLHGQKFSYSDIIDDKSGFLYADYQTFKDGETLINNIIDNMPSNLSDLERVRYIYISLGKIVNSDINVTNEKNEAISFENISIVNNLWSAITKGKITDLFVSKLFMFLCSRIHIKCELISSSVKGNIANKVYINDSFLIVDLFNDIYNIQGSFITKFFDKYNNDKKMDKKVGYIREEYTDYYLDMLFKCVDYNDDKVVLNVLSFTSKLFNISQIGTVELSKIYSFIFEKYFPNYNIKINNFFTCNDMGSREHFIVISYNNDCYGFSYNKNCFIDIGYNILFNNLKDNKIGLYDGEDFYSEEKEFVL